MVGRTRDAEAELNLPPGFRFHPTDEELVMYYLCRKAAHQCLPVPIIAEVDLYKYDPWDLPEKALFGQREWYFFTPRDRKYPNGSRPNRAAGRGYWKATGADKPVSPDGSKKPLGIKKALVFYHGKAPKGVKTDWIMHEYRLADTNHSAKKGTLRLDEWVLCRLYNKKNSREKMQHQREASFGESADFMLANEDTGSDSLRTPESDIEHDPFIDFNDFSRPAVHRTLACDDVKPAITSNTFGAQPAVEKLKEDSDWFMDLNLDDLHGSAEAFNPMPSFDVSNQDYFFSTLNYPHLRPSQTNMPPF